MKTTFYDRLGRPVATSDDGQLVRDHLGRAVARIEHPDQVYSVTGHRLGMFRDGWIRDHAGKCVFFTKDAKGGPVRPIKRYHAFPRAGEVPPLKVVKKSHTIPPLDSFNWSELSGPKFFKED